jgi:hypothetical protein
VIPVNDVPVLAEVETSSLPYTENGAAVAISPSITVSDVDWIWDASLDSALVNITSGMNTGDVLAYAGASAAITAVFDASTGVLTMTGSVAQADWQTALKAVTFSSSSEDPTGTQSASDRTVSFVISDGDLTSSAVTRTVVVNPVTDAPVLAGVESSVLNYTEN